MNNISVLVCRGCCCGSTDKHPDTDHDTQISDLRDALPPNGKLWTVDCLGPCKQSNVVVLRQGQIRRWFGRLLERDATRRFAAWLTNGVDEPPPPDIAAREFQPDSDDDVEIVPIDLDTAGITDLVHTTISDGAATWTVGVLGAIAEYHPGPTQTVRRPDPRVVEAVSDDGAIRIEIHPEMRAFAVRRTDGSIRTIHLTVPRPITTTHHLITEVGHDTNAVRAADRSSILLDLGIGVGHTVFAVRSNDAAVLARLRSYAGARWSDLLHRDGEFLVTSSPHRIVQSAAARIEVRSPIPPPTGTSPDGSHTHLLPAQLELGRELAVGLHLPPDLTSAAAFHLSAGITWPSGVIPT